MGYMMIVLNICTEQKTTFPLFCEAWGILRYSRW